MPSRIKEKTSKISPTGPKTQMINQGLTSRSRTRTSRTSSNSRIRTARITNSNNRIRIDSRNSAFNKCRTRIGSNNKGGNNSRDKMRPGSKNSVPSNNSARTSSNNRRGRNSRSEEHTSELQ